MVNYPRSRKVDIVMQELKNEVLIYDLKINKAYCLNKTAALVWNLCSGTNSVDEISRQLSKKLNSPVTQDLVWLTLNELKKIGLLENEEEIETKFEGLSRREVVRKIGFTSLVALPVITSVIAPTSAQAASGAVPCNPSLVCTTNPECVGMLGPGATCVSGCCTGGGIPGGGCILGPGNPCPPSPPGCDPIFGC